MTAVKAGQIWADQDPRSAGRTLRVDRIEGTKAVCTVLTNDTVTQADLARSGKDHRGRQDRRGKETSISLARFKPVSTGYRLIRDTQYGVQYKPSGHVFAFPSREAAEAELARDGRGIAVLVVHEYEPGTSNCTEWREVED